MTPKQAPLNGGMMTSPQFEGLHDAYLAVAGQIAGHHEYANAPRQRQPRVPAHGLHPG
jgi:hypothetical protein